jgi:hypothetical protein
MCHPHANAYKRSGGHTSYEPEEECFHASALYVSFGWPEIDGTVGAQD